MSFPINRMRRLRATPGLRDMVRETRLDVKDFIYPLFVVHGSEQENPVNSMPGVYQYSVDRLKPQIKDCGFE